MARQKNDGKGRMGGRPPGGVNKTTRVCRERIQLFLDEKWDEAIETWEKIDKPADKMHVFIKLMEFAIPKMAHIELKDDRKAPDWAQKLESLRKK